MITIRRDGQTYHLEMTQDGNNRWIVKYQKVKIATFYRTPYSWRMETKRKSTLLPVLAEAIKQLNQRDFNEFPVVIDREQVSIRVISKHQYVVMIREDVELLVYYDGYKWRVRGEGALKYRSIANSVISYLKSYTAESSSL
ncbi:hypothetical protein [Paenibacillus thiaminolyticus]|uniref:Uncharacterized protein n=1 Tax=Paenibacillus thiaminolyticus TaxID=49283 RepID=A0A3A3GJI7_PANTH|nr:hypothetical protein [Paenibacillus thiaminolyticus]RJG24351.1 hypothetical protein DQX05_10895 [Paenibacillus thiaminolyticus]